MPRTQPITFSQVVCGPPAVRGAFARHRPTRRWWQIILWLHGKPEADVLAEPERTTRLADGFRFYAGLYRVVASIFLLLAPALFTISVYFAVGSLLAGVYLWFVSGLGYAGAHAYRAEIPERNTALLAFFVMIIAFLSLFVGAVSVTVQHLALLPPLLNLLGAAALFAFGIGSYLIEIVFLATDRCLDG